MLIQIKDDNGKVLGIMTANSKTFKTGSTGFFGSAKLEVDGKRYQVQFQAVEIGSKNKSGNE